MSLPGGRGASSRSRVARGHDGRILIAEIVLERDRGARRDGARGVSRRTHPRALGAEGPFGSRENNAIVAETLSRSSFECQAHFRGPKALERIPEGSPAPSRAHASPPRRRRRRFLLFAPEEWNRRAAGRIAVMKSEPRTTRKHSGRISARALAPEIPDERYAFRTVVRRKESSAFR